jgi:stage II sporulation protein D
LWRYTNAGDGDTRQKTSRYRRNQRAVLRITRVPDAGGTVLRRFVLAAAAVFFWLPSALAQGSELSRADRLAILYTPQLTFAATGEPLIKIGIVEGVESVEFSADTAVTILPLGESGPRIEVPAGAALRVTARDGEPGQYRHRVVLEELAPGERAQLPDVLSRWRAEGLEIAPVEVGSLFAIAGQRFDTRRTLVTAAGASSLSDTQQIADSLAQRYGVDARIHSDLDEYPGGTLVLDGLPGGVTVTHRDLLQVRGELDTVFTVVDVPHDVGTRYEDTETRRYSGSLIFTFDRNGLVAVVNETTLERILYGVVPAEIYTSAPAEALRAQAVAARSEILRDLGARHLADPYMTCSDQRCQVYGGLAYEQTPTTNAVDATRGTVLTSGDLIIRANYSANNGGFAASNQSTWGDAEQPYLRARFDGPGDGGVYADGLTNDELVRDFLANPPDVWSDITSFGSGRSFRWTETLDAEALTTAVNQRYAVGDVRGLEILARDSSGRVTQMRITGDRDEVVVERELNVRRAFGGLRSALFVMEVETSGSSLVSVTFVGGGFGHGVGLCQSGSIGAAEAGLSYEEILENYYPGTVLRELY